LAKIKKLNVLSFCGIHLLMCSCSKVQNLLCFYNCSLFI